jgi:hypothetical protein
VDKRWVIHFLEETGENIYAAQALRETDDLQVLVLDHGVVLALQVEFKD